jgi:hypothetical protein
LVPVLRLECAEYETCKLGGLAKSGVASAVADHCLTNLLASRTVGALVVGVGERRARELGLRTASLTLLVEWVCDVVGVLFRGLKNHGGGCEEQNIRFGVVN